MPPDPYRVRQYCSEADRAHVSRTQSRHDNCRLAGRSCQWRRNNSATDVEAGRHGDERLRGNWRTMRAGKTNYGAPTGFAVGLTAHSA